MKSKILAVLGLAFAITGCNATPNSTHNEMNTNLTKQELNGKNFDLVQIDGEKLVVPEGNRKPNINFQMDDGQLRAFGNSGCNRFNGLVHLKDNSFSIHPMMSTRMMCPMGGSDIEGTVIKVLAGQDKGSIKLNGKYLTITKDGKELKYYETYYN